MGFTKRVQRSCISFPKISHAYLINGWDTGNGEATSQVHEVTNDGNPKEAGIESVMAKHPYIMPIRLALRIGEVENKSILSKFVDKMKNMEDTHNVGTPTEVVNDSQNPTQVQLGWDDPKVHAVKGSFVDKVDKGLDGNDNGLTNSRKSFVNVVNDVDEGQSMDQAKSQDTCNVADAMKDKNSFADVVSSTKPTAKVNFGTLFNAETVEDSDFVLPIETINAVKHRYENSLVAYFVGKRVAFTLVKSYVTNTWGKFGFQKIMRDDDGFFFFKVASIAGVEQVLEHGPGIIRNMPLILNKWTPSLSMCKDKVTNVPAWVKMHGVPVVAYSEDGLSLIGSKIGKPIILDAYTSSMCVDAWGRIGFARALIEITAKKELKKM
ncbi:reverse transcriptase domain-containing protein [Tanacetum coccineum]